MTQDDRISASDARREVAAGRALLVCAYDDAAKCAPVSGKALPLDQFRARLGTLPASQQIFFICG